MTERVLGGRYTLQDKIGTGGMAIVYRAIDNVLDRAVAIKIMLPQYATDPSFAARFKQEAQSAAALQSPYIVSVYDWGRDGNTYYIAMEYLRGTDLKSGIRNHGALDCRKVAQIGRQIAQALSVAHRHDIIHRDIKPQNIMVQPDGNIKVMDFGIARAKNAHLTTDNAVLGTAHYVSPEQTQGKELEPTTDIYSLGIVMYEAATGQVPFQGDDSISVALKQVNEQPVPPSQINPDIDASFEAIILKCMQKDPAARFQSAEELAMVLSDYLQGHNVDAATMVMGNSTTQVMDRTGQTAVQPILPAGATTHTQRQTATEEAEERDAKRKRRLVTGIICGLVALTAIVAVAIMLINSASQVILVPNLVGLTEEAARESIESSGFEVGEVSEDYSSEVAEGLVMSQDPDYGESAVEGTAINFVISLGEAPAGEVEVPNLTGLTPTQAENTLTRLGLVGRAGDPIYSDSVDTGYVAGQDIDAGTMVEEGTTITYYLSQGPQPITIPNVVGYNYSTAISMLESAGFEVSTQTATTTDSSSDGIVYDQSPASGGTGSRGTTVTIYYYVYQAPAVTSSPTTTPSTTDDDYDPTTDESSSSNSGSSSGSGSTSSAGAGGE